MGVIIIYFKNFHSKAEDNDMTYIQKTFRLKQRIPSRRSPPSR